METDLIKIKEDSIKLQEIDILDVLKSINNENIKSFFILIFILILIAAIDNFNNLPIAINILFFILTIGSVIFALYNILSKKINIHTNVDDIFIKNFPTQWEEHLQNKHLFLNDSYKEVKKIF